MGPEEPLGETGAGGDGRATGRGPRGRCSVGALLFDLGGVVIGVDFERTFKFWAERARCDPGAIRDRFRVDEAFERHEKGELDAAGFFAALRRSLDIDLSDAEFRAGWDDIYLGPVPGMAALLRAARGHFPLFAFTNTNRSHQQIWCARLQLELSYFQAVFVSCELGVRKPDPCAFSRVANIVGRPTSDFLFFDDSMENVVGAREAGMSAVLVRSVADVRDALQTLGVETG